MAKDNVNGKVAVPLFVGDPSYKDLGIQTRALREDYRNMDNYMDRMRDERINNAMGRGARGTTSF